jgi:transcriptional regulator with XRE-family HTH domain
MADSRYWRRPGRRDEERKKFSELMRKLERFRLREGITKRELARRLNTSEDAIHYWLSGRTIGRKATVERVEEFLRDAP